VFRIDDEDGVGQAIHAADAIEILGELPSFFLEARDFFLGQRLVTAVGRHRLEFAQPGEAARNLNVGTHGHVPGDGCTDTPSTACLEHLVARCPTGSTSCVDLDRQQMELEKKRVNYAFDNIDRLFSKAMVKIQAIDQEGSLGTENIMDLNSYLEGTHDLSLMINILKDTMGLALSERKLRFLTDSQHPSFATVIKVLWKYKMLSTDKAYQLLVMSSPLTSKELVRLVENGAVKTIKGSFVQLRTGDVYGDVLKLFDVITAAVTKIKNEDQARSGGRWPVTDLLCASPPRALRMALKDAGFDSERTISDAWVIQEIRKHFLFVGSLAVYTKFRQFPVSFNPGYPGGDVVIDNVNYATWQGVWPSSAVLLVTNYYFNNIDASMNNGWLATPLGLTFFGAMNFLGYGPNWWMYYTDGYLGGGINYSVNFSQGTFWSSGDPTFLNVGIIGAGWKDSLTAGITLQTVLAQNILLGLYGYISVSRSHDVAYRGEYPMDGKIASIRGLHKIEISDNEGITKQAAASVNLGFLSTPLGVAFRASDSLTTQRIYRTHRDLQTAQKMIGEAGFPGVLYIVGKKIKETIQPKFEEPDQLREGDELLETKIGKLSGNFVFGLDSTVQFAATRIGASVEVTAEFGLGLKRLPTNKFEVSIEIKRIFEIGLFAGALNLAGVGHVKSLALARKQIFIFDFSSGAAKEAYYDLIMHGRLPISEEIEVYYGDGGPEYLLTEFRAQNEAIRWKGIARTFLEAMSINSEQTFFGFSSPLATNIVRIINRLDHKVRRSKRRLHLRLEGVDRAYFHSDAESVATNGLIAVHRSTCGGRRSRGQGFSGRYNEDLFVTHRRIHSVDDADPNFTGNKWQFDSLVVHGQLEDTLVTGNEENRMAQRINRLFSTFIGPFEQRNSRMPRKINLERDISKNDIYELTQPVCFDRVPATSQITGIKKARIYEFITELKNKHVDLQGQLVKKFMDESEGLTGFAAIHQLLGAKPERLYISTETGYSDAATKAKEFITKFSDVEQSSEHPRVNLIPMKSEKKSIRTFFALAKFHMNELDRQLRLLSDDKYLLDENSRLITVYGEQKVKALINAGVRQDKSKFQGALTSVRKSLMRLLDLKSQQFSDLQRMLLYETAHKADLSLEARVELFLRDYENQAISPNMNKDYLRRRLTKSWSYMAKLARTVKELENDAVMKRMDQEYVTTVIAQRDHLIKRLDAVTSFDHLSAEQREEIKRKFADSDRIMRLFPFRKRYDDLRIRTMLATINEDAEPEHEAVSFDQVAVSAHDS